MVYWEQSGQIKEVYILTDDDPSSFVELSSSTATAAVHADSLHPDRNLEDFSLKKLNRLSKKQTKTSLKSYHLGIILFREITFLPNNEVPTWQV